jgi:sphingolipid delta-4 desaturase
MATAESAWHMRRRREILQAHPEIRRLQGPDPRTAMWVVGLVVAQLVAAVWISTRGWPVVVVGGWVAGALVSHALGVLIHECSHDLAFKRPWANKLLGIVANLPLAAPAAIDFRKQHLLHHQHLGEADGRDTQAPTRMEADLVGRGTVAKIISFTFGRFYYPSRPANHVPFDRWRTFNFAAVIAVDLALWSGSGPKPLVYLVVAALAGFGPYPTGARRLSEHLALRTSQPTLSYYGVLNALSFNVGYHVEHHDFPQIPWSRARAQRVMAAEHYDQLYAVRSWTALLVRYFFDARYRVDQYVGMGGRLSDDEPYRPPCNRGAAEERSCARLDHSGPGLA